MFCKKLSLLVVLFLPLSGCTPEELYQNEHVKEAQVTDRTRAGDILEALPPSSEKIAVSLYDFQDQTGQLKYNDKYADFSSAVTKGGLSILTKALLDAGNKKWFTVTERGGLNNLIQERTIIKAMRNEYRTPDGQKLPELPPLIYGGMLLQGGIIGYDSNVITGGAGALYLGLGSSVKYARDVVTVYLRAVSVQTGEVLLSVTSSKTIFSTAMDSNVLKYITFDRLLQAEAGFTLNEPVQLATRQAIETAVYSMIMEGAIDGLWEFKDKAAGQRAVAEYIARRDGPRQDQPGQDGRIFEKSLVDSAPGIGGSADMMSAQPAAQMVEQQPRQAPMQQPRENPVATAAQTQPVASQTLPPPQAQPVAPQAAAVAAPVVAQPVAQPVMAQPQANVVVVPANVQPVQQPVMAQPVAQPAAVQPSTAVVKNREFEPQVAPESSPISQNMPQQPVSAQVAQQMAALQPASVATMSAPVAKEGPVSVNGWGYDRAENAQPQASSVIPVAYQQPLPSARQRPSENDVMVYY